MLKPKNYPFRFVNSHHILFIYMEAAFMNFTAASQQGELLVFWLHLRADGLLSILFTVHSKDMRPDCSRMFHQHGVSSIPVILNEGQLCEGEVAPLKY